MPVNSQLVEPNALREAVDLGVMWDNVEIERERKYVKLMEEDSIKIETTGRFLDLIATRTQGLKGQEPSLINFWNHPDQSALLDQARELCPEIIPESTYVFDVDHLAKIAEMLHARITNVYNAHLTQIQTMLTQTKLMANAIFECMTSIVKRCIHALERIIANMLSHR
ncbi:MAG TPA: hypothetical protein VLF61_03390 [Rhabdochlamydiaceae bacterium]|nr:hypothetical protein [Rhabdochlamydiaceae bacterium]